MGYFIKKKTKLKKEEIEKSEYYQDLNNYLQKLGINIISIRIDKRTKPRWFDSKVVTRVYLYLSTDDISVELYISPLGDLVRVEVGDMVVANLKRKGTQIKDTYKKLGKSIFNAVNTQLGQHNEIGDRMSSTQLNQMLSRLDKDVKHDGDIMDLLPILKNGSGFYLVLNGEDNVWSEKQKSYTDTNHLMSPYKTKSEALKVAEKNKGKKVIKL